MRLAITFLPALVITLAIAVIPASAQTTTEEPAPAAAPAATATTSTATMATTTATAAPETTATIAAPAPAKLKKKAPSTCVTLGFEVNDYGKDGPTKDAKSLLDAYVVKWAAANSIEKYKMGEKSVDCELFLDFGVFDEHTCTASADVCWQGEPKKEALVSPE